jgi:hypothetical protein
MTGYHPPLGKPVVAPWVDGNAPRLNLSQMSSRFQMRNLYELKRPHVNVPHLPALEARDVMVHLNPFKGWSYGR